MVALLQKEFGGLPCREVAGDVLLLLGRDGIDAASIALAKQQLLDDLQSNYHSSGPVKEPAATELAQKLGLTK